jgi:transcriptional regulator with XRE-family HTH domain
MRDQGYSVRSLEEEIVKKYGPKKKISRGLIGDYKLGKRAPTYERALLLADVLGIDEEELLIAVFRLKNRTREAAEWDRFEKFCRRRKIEITRGRVQ